MVYFKKNKRGQAAIEFLMTYGWMLLVVLVVGALIFSFVDFGSLLPNKVDLNNNLRASATESFAYSKDSVTSPNQVFIVFTYNGVKRVEIPGKDNYIVTSDTGDYCNSTIVVNSDTNVNSTASGSTNFLNGQTGYVVFNCSNIKLIKGDALDGQMVIFLKNIKTHLKTPSSGQIHLTIN